MENLMELYRNLPSGVSLLMHGRYGYLYYKNEIGYVEYYVELSGVPQYQFLIWFHDITTWAFPLNKSISTHEKNYIKALLIDFLEGNGISSNIHQQ